MSNATSRLPSRPSLEQLRKQAKERLQDLRINAPAAKLADAQLLLAREYGFETWPKLVAHVEATKASPRNPRLTAPVSRILGTTDSNRAIAYWRDVLGFEVSEAEGGATELSCGPARIRFGTQDLEPYLDEARAPGAASIFFETDDLAGLRDLLTARGGTPSELVKVNGIKMRMFQVRDPDGHVVWFGQSYHEDSPPRPKVMMETIIPEIPLDDVPRGIRHYCDALGFSINYAQDDLGVLDRDAVRVALIARTDKHTGIASAYLYVRDADALHAELVAKGANIQGTPTSQPWGLREFCILDPEGNRLTFGQPFE